MTNEEKAKELASSERISFDELNDSYCNGIECGALEMAEWKDEEFKEFKNLVKEFLHDCDIKHCFKNMFWPIELQKEIEKYL